MNAHRMASSRICGTQRAAPGLSRSQQLHRKTAHLTLEFCSKPYTHNASDSSKHTSSINHAGAGTALPSKSCISTMEREPGTHRRFVVHPTTSSMPANNGSISPTNRQTRWRNGPGTTLQESQKDAASITRNTQERYTYTATATGPLDKMSHTLDTPTTQDIRYIVFSQNRVLEVSTSG